MEKRFTPTPPAENGDRVKDGVFRLHEALITGQDAGHMLEELSSLTGCSVLRADPTMRIIMSVGDMTFLGIFSDLSAGDILPSQAAQKLSGTPAPTLHEAEGVRFAACPVWSDAAVESWVLLIERDRPVLEPELRLLGILCRTLAYNLRREIGAADCRGREYEDLVSGILDGRFTEQQIKSRLSSLMLSLKPEKFVYSVGEAADDAMGSQHMSDSRLELVKGYMERLFPGCLCMHYRDVAVVFLSSDKPVPLSLDAFNGLCEFLRENNLLCGISNNFSELSDMRAAYTQSKSVMQLARRLHAPGSAFLYWEFAFLVMIEGLQYEHPPLDYCNPILLGIQEYDKSYNTAYAETLRVYIDSGQNPSDTAQKLGIHRNTVDYRINRIRERFHVDFKNAAMMFSFHMTYQIQYFLENYYRI